MNNLSVFLSRLDFSWVTSMHILYPPLTIGLAILLFFSEYIWFKTENMVWYNITNFFSKIFIINFGAGVATGITMEMAFGILYGPFSQAAGPFFGQVLGYETITAFMYEAGFLGLMIFGWHKINRKMHLFATFNVALSSSLSAFWILVANGWMQTPNGVTFKNGTFYVKNWFDAIVNKGMISGFIHMFVATIELSLFVVVAISAWFILKNNRMFLAPLKYCLLALLIIAPLQVYLGDSLGQNVFKNQPSAIAALEGHYHTYNSNGTVNNSWNILAWPNKDNTKNVFSVKVPYLLSILETHSLNGKVKGLDDFSAKNRPSEIVPFYSFRIMVAAGMVMMILGVYGGFFVLTKKDLTQQKIFLKSLVLSPILPYVAVWTGWWARETARQPWIVYKMMYTYQGVSHMSIFAEIFWLVGYSIFELSVFLGTMYFILKTIRNYKAPTDEENFRIINNINPDEKPMDLNI